MTERRSLAAPFYNDFFKPPRLGRQAAVKRYDAGSVRFHDEVRVRKIKAKGEGQPVSSMYEDDSDSDLEEDEEEGRENGPVFMDDGDADASEESDEGHSSGGGESEGDIAMDNTIQRLQDDLFADEEDDLQQGSETLIVGGILLN